MFLLILDSRLEWLGSAHIPLATILCSARSCLELTLQLKTHTDDAIPCEPILLDVSITDDSRDTYPWAHILDYYAMAADGLFL